MTDRERFESMMGSHYAPEPNTGCWLWLRTLAPNGYARLTWHRRTWVGHRLAYELLRGPIPDGLTLDHLCRVRSCVNPDHLEPVTERENHRRGIPRNSRKIACHKGHPFNESNTLWMGDGRRRCRICETERAAKYRSKNVGSGRGRGEDR